jgi:hypothetical protein
MCFDILVSSLVPVHMDDNALLNPHTNCQAWPERSHDHHDPHVCCTTAEQRENPSLGQLGSRHEGVCGSGSKVPRLLTSALDTGLVAVRFTSLSHGPQVRNPQGGVPELEYAHQTK